MEMELLGKKKLSIEKRLVRAKVQLLMGHPFFGTLSYHLKTKEISGDPVMGAFVPTAGVDGQYLYYNKEWLEKFTDEEIKTILAHEVLHCLTPDTPILTNHGYIPIKDIKVGDRVYCHWGCFTKVTRVFIREYSGNIIKITPEYSEPIRITPEHPILSLKYEYKYYKGFRKSVLEQNAHWFRRCRFKPAKELDKHRDALIFPLPILSRKRVPSYRIRKHYKQYKVSIDEEFAYFLGWFLGDGYLGKQKKTRLFGERKKEKYSERVIYISANITDDTERLKRVIQEKLLRSPSSFKPKDVQVERIMFSSRSLAKFLRKYFYNEQGKYIPPWFIGLPKEIIANFIQGLLEADGYSKNGRCVISSSNPGIYSFLPLLLSKLGKYTSLKKNKSETGFPTNKQNMIIAWQEDRKTNTSIISKNRWYIPIRNIEQEYYSGYVYNIETDANTYTVPSFIVHNCALSHLDRRGHRNKNKFNMAADFATNDLLHDAGFTLPEGCLHDQNYHNMNAEKIYELLPEQKYPVWDVMIEVGQGGGDGDKEGKDGAGEAGGGKDEGTTIIKDVKIPTADPEEVKKWRLYVAEAATVARMQGKLPAGIEELLKDILAPKVNWREVLRQFLVSNFKNDYSFLPPSKKHIHNGLVLPSLKTEGIGTVVIGVDTSGSISNENLQQFFGEIQSILNTYEMDLHVIQADAIVQKHDTYRRGDVLGEIEIKGRGGTSFKPVFDMVQEENLNPACLIYLTDLWGDFPEEAPEYPVLWVAVTQDEVPFGEVIRIGEA